MIGNIQYMVFLLSLSLLHMIFPAVCSFKNKISGLFIGEVTPVDYNSIINSPVVVIQFWLGNPLLIISFSC